MARRECIADNVDLMAFEACFTQFLAELSGDFSRADPDDSRDVLYLSDFDNVLPFETGDTTQAMLAFKNDATATIATSLKTPGFVWRCAVYGSEMWAESLSETKVTVCGRDGKPQTFDVPQTNHIGANLDSFAAAALGQGTYQIDDAGILHTVAALEAVFDSAERNGAWRDIA